MFEQPRNLIIVFKEKDELELNQMRKLVENKDDDTDNK